ncbi:TOXD protein [Colletotrichum scovillei]|uniref:TOXD protein n=1 Tax=Colletotrichum scovillei TaxID=1209932 RepID=UPI0015C3F21D|nr:TOXD protein [Colletotrichum scovillei]KAF4783610.1 TOXD protein [Colletotrichum scovillei]
MSSNHAIVIQGAGKASVVEASIPKLRDDYLIVKVKAVALNPTDILHIDLFAVTGARVGCDYAGIVEEVGSKVAKPFKKGDRIAGVAHGSNAVHHEDGTFAEYITVKGDLQLRIPDNVTFEEAATLGVGVTTVGQGLYQSLGLPYIDQPSTEKLPVLIYGGSTATGALAIQKLGADVILDYKSATVVEDIKKSAGGKLKHVLDCISSESSADISVKAIAEDGGVYSTLRPVPAELVSAINSKFGSKFWADTERLLGEGKIVAHKPTVNEGGSGLEGVLKGLDLVRQGKVSGTKLVYVVS